MRFLRVLAAGLLSVGALVGLFLAFCILPKIAQAEADFHTTTPSWISVPVSLVDYWMLNLIYLLSALLLAAIVLALLPFVAQSVRRAAVGTLYFMAFGASASALYLLTVAAAGMIFVNGDLSNKNNIYASVLDQFSLRESADGKFDQIQAFFAHMNSARMVEVKDASTLSPQQRKEQIHGLLYGIKASKDVPFLKQVLATSDLLKSDIIRDSFDAKPILEAAALCGAPSDDINKFYDWLEPKIGTDGWNQIPLHVMVFDN